nr:MAG TPA: hypothetical protein [Caudoviricetes sp.]
MHVITCSIKCRRVVFTRITFLLRYCDMHSIAC